MLHACARVSGDYELLLSDDDGREPECERDSSSTAPRLASRKVVKSVGKKLKKSLSVVAHSPAASRRTRPRKEAPRYSSKWRVRSVRRVVVSVYPSFFPSNIVRNKTEQSYGPQVAGVCIASLFNVGNLSIRLLSLADGSKRKDLSRRI